MEMTDEQKKEYLIRKTVQQESMAELEKGFKKMNRKQRRELLKARSHPCFTKKYSSPKERQNAIKRFETELILNRQDLRSK